jgi:hypothetical protein
MIVGYDWIMSNSILSNRSRFCRYFCTAVSIMRLTQCDDDKMNMWNVTDRKQVDVQYFQYD